MKKNKDRNLLIFVGCVLLLSILTLTVSYAVLSTTLNIKGSAKIRSASWNINLTGSQDFSTYGQAKFGYPTITATSIYDMKVDMYQPGDGVKFPFSVHNDGTIDAKLKTIIKGDLNCSGVNMTDASNTCKNITYKITYANGDEIVEGDILESGGVQKFVLEVVFNKDTDYIPLSEITVDGIDATLIYEQK